MWFRTLVFVAAVIGAGSLAGVVLAQFSSTRTASGTISVSDMSAALYICEPGNVPGPSCGADDGQGDERVFERLENMKPGDVAEWDLRLKNVGTEALMISNASITFQEVLDPSDDCPDRFEALRDIDTGFGPRVLTILGKDGDSVNDNPTSDDFPMFPVINPQNSVVLHNIRIGAGDYEDVRIGLALAGTAAEKCDGNVWNVFWVITALPVS